MTKKVLLRLLSIVATVMLFSVIYEIKLPFDKAPSGKELYSWEQGSFGMPHIAIQWLLAFSIIGMIIELVIHLNKEHEWFK